jgi:hypothetical protein
VVGGVGGCEQMAKHREKKGRKKERKKERERGGKGEVNLNLN